MTDEDLCLSVPAGVGSCRPAGLEELGGWWVRMPLQKTQRPRNRKASRNPWSSKSEGVGWCGDSAPREDSLVASGLRLHLPSSFRDYYPNLTCPWPPCLAMHSPGCSPTPGNQLSGSQLQPAPSCASPMRPCWAGGLMKGQGSSICKPRRKA